VTDGVLLGVGHGWPALATRIKSALRKGIERVVGIRSNNYSIRSRLARLCRAQSNCIFSARNEVPPLE